MTAPIRPEVREHMNRIGKLLDDILQPMGFALLVFDLNSSRGFMNYISNAKRDDMVTALKEFVARNEGRVPPEAGKQ